jgi:hypothetical protein
MIKLYPDVNTTRKSTQDNALHSACIGVKVKNNPFNPHKVIDQESWEKIGDAHIIRLFYTDHLWVFTLTIDFSQYKEYQHVKERESIVKTFPLKENGSQPIDLENYSLYVGFLEKIMMIQASTIMNVLGLSYTTQKVYVQDNGYAVPEPLFINWSGFPNISKGEKKVYSKNEYPLKNYSTQNSGCFKYNSHYTFAGKKLKLFKCNHDQVFFDLITPKDVMKNYVNQGDYLKEFVFDDSDTDECEQYQQHQQQQ